MPFQRHKCTEKKLLKLWIRTKTVLFQQSTPYLEVFKIRFDDWFLYMTGDGFEPTSHGAKILPSYDADRGPWTARLTSHVLRCVLIFSQSDWTLEGASTFIHLPFFLPIQFVVSQLHCRVGCKQPVLIVVEKHIVEISTAFAEVWCGCVCVYVARLELRLVWLGWFILNSETWFLAGRKSKRGL